MRIKIFSLIILTVFVMLGACLFWVQIMKGGYYYRLSQNNRIRLVPQDAMRGDILDNKGKKIADSVMAYDLTVSPQDLKNKKELKRTLEKLSVVLAMPFSELEAIYRKKYTAPFADVVILKDISRELIFKIEQLNIELPAVFVKPSPQRRYAYREAASHILGYLGEIDKEQLTQLTQYGYRRQDLIGKTGIEKKFDMILRGEDGGMQIEVNNKNYQVAVLSSKQAKPGTEIELTVSADLQAYAYSLLAGRRGAVILLDPNDGKILCMVSSPGFDPNTFGPRGSSKETKAILRDSTMPLLNRAVQGEYPPGSIFKIVTATAGLQTKKISANSPIFYCPGFYILGGRRFNCWEKEGHGKLDLMDAINHSCNVFFFKASQIIKQEPITYYSYIFGLGRPTSVEIPAEVKGFIPDKNWKRRVIGESWYEGDTLNFSIGQGYTLITPLQAAVMVSVIANGGKLVHPYIVESVAGVKIKRPQPKQVAVSIRTIDIVKEAMYNAVESEGGTGIMARTKGIKVSGKTGTAQVFGHQSHAWFVGYAPSENPKVAIAVFLENGGYGGESAAPIAGAMFKKMKQEGML